MAVTFSLPLLSLTMFLVLVSPIFSLMSGDGGTLDGYGFRFARNLGYAKRGNGFNENAKRRALVSNWGPSSGIPLPVAGEKPGAIYAVLPSNGQDSSSSLLNRSKLRLLAYLFSGKSQAVNSNGGQAGMVAKRDMFDAAIDDDVEPSEFLG